MRDKFESLEAMAEALRRRRGFERTNKSTILRWLQNEESLRSGEEPGNDTPGRATLERAREAAQLLDRESSTLRVAYHPSLLYLPVMLAQAPRGRTGRSLLDQDGVCVEPRLVPTGSEGLKKLCHGEVDVAFGYRYLPDDELDQELKQDCSRLTSYCRYQLAGLASQPVSSATMQLRKLRYGIPAASGVPNFLRRHLGALDQPTQSFLNEKEAADLLFENKVDVVIWWEPQINLVEPALRAAYAANQIDAKDLEPLPPGALPQIPIDIFVNRNAAARRPRETIAFFYCLYQICAQLGIGDFLKEVESSALRKLADELGVEGKKNPAAALTRAVASYDFLLDQVDLGTLFRFWRDKPASEGPTTLGVPDAGEAS